MANDTEWQNHKKIVQAGLRRFADEGYVNWNRANVEKLFHPYSLDDPLVVEALRNWNASGGIELLRDESHYLRLIDPERLNE